MLVLSSLALLVIGIYGRSNLVAWFIAAEFAGYAMIIFVLSVRLGGASKLFQWVLFAGVGLLATIGAIEP